MSTSFGSKGKRERKKASLHHKKWKGYSSKPKKAQKPELTEAEKELLERERKRDKRIRKYHIEKAKNTMRENTGLMAMQNYADRNKDLSKKKQGFTKLAKEYSDKAESWKDENKRLAKEYEEGWTEIDKENKKWDRSGLLSFRKKGETKEMKNIFKQMEQATENVGHAEASADAALGFNRQVDKKRKKNDERMERIIASRMGAKLGGKTKKKRRRTKKKRRKTRRSKKKRRKRRRTKKKRRRRR